MHTTSGLPFLNYFPDKIAMSYSKNFRLKEAYKITAGMNYLRAGIRGGSVKELHFLRKHHPNLFFKSESN